MTSTSTTSSRRADTPSRAVVETVAAREGVDPIDLETPLYETVDPDALDALVGAPTPAERQQLLHVVFEYHGYEVRVSADGDVSVSRPV